MSLLIKGRRSTFQGTILYIALVFIAVINLLALAYVKAIPTESNSILRSQRANLAHYACEAGVNDSLAFITFELKMGREPTPRGAIERSGTHSGWSWKARITPDASSPPRGLSALRCYEIVSRAYAPDSTEPSRLIRTVVIEETFARYTNYMDLFPASIYYNLRGSGTFIEGHVHTNTYFNMEPSDARYASNDGPAFLGYVTSAGAASSPWDYDGVDYMRASQAPYDSDHAPIADRYEKIFLGGRSGLNTGVNRIEMPDTVAGMARRSWGSDSAPPTDPGVHYTLEGGEIAGGYYVVGDIKKMQLAAENGVAKLTFTQEGDQTTVIVEAHDRSYDLNGRTIRPGNVGILYPNGSIGVVPGMANGLFHCTGDIESLEGTNFGARLISADLEAGKKIVVTGNILRADTRRGERPNGSRDVLGLVTYQVILSKTIPRDTSNPLYLYLSYLAGRQESYPRGGLIVEDYGDEALGRGVFYMYGSAGAGRVYATGNSEPDTGFGYRHYYDQHAINSPPPFYPTTGKLPVRSWREEDGTL